jgi:hypothetical protein
MQMSLLSVSRTQNDQIKLFARLHVSRSVVLNVVVE